MDMIKESVFDDIIARSKGNELRNEDKLDEVNLKALNRYIEKFTDKDSFDGYKNVARSLTSQIFEHFRHYILKYRDLFEYMEEYEGYDVKTILQYVDDNWDKGMNIKNIIMNKVNIEESVFDDIISRSKGNEIRKEDKFNEDDRKVLDTYIEIFSNEVALGNGEYQETLDDFIAYIKDFQDKPKISNMNPDIPKLVMFVKMNWSDRENICEIISDKIDNVREEYGGDDVNESVFDDIIARSKGNDLRNEDKLNKNELDFIDQVIDKFCNEPNIDDDWEIEYSLVEFLLYFKEKCEEDGYDYQRLKKYIQDNWTMGKQICDIVNPYPGNDVKESVFDDIIARSKGSSIRKEDEMNDRKFIDICINGFADDEAYYKHGVDLNDIDEFFEYIDRLDSIRDNVEDLDGVAYDKERCKRYIRGNWNQGEDIHQKILDEYQRYMKKINECDCVSPNGGLTFGDVSGMGPITFPGECGERGSGDLPMPSGKVYRQVAPFSSFIKIKKKKRKKFSKKDEPCAQYDNPPIYNHVDDFRDYVSRLGLD